MIYNHEKPKNKRNSHGIWRYMALLMFCLSMSTMALAQSKIIRGEVDDVNGYPIIGATVTIDGTKRGTVTDLDGNFSIEASPKDQLTITYVGYIKKNVTAGNGANLRITLQEDNTELGEVVVVGYGTQRKATLTGAVSSVGNQEITVTKNENVVNMLAGKLPGVRITQTSSRPGAFDNQFDIRGLGAPLIVIDGVPSDADTFQRMDASEIENVSVLKDASAAIYGLRSANGVILVTTRRGTANGALNISYSINYGWQQFLQVPDNVDALQYMTLANEKTRRTQTFFNSNPSLPPFTDTDRQPYEDGTLRTTDWMGAIFKNTVPQSQHNVTINGGSDRIKYFFNLGYMNQDGALRSGSMNYDRWNFRSNVDAQITKRLKASVSIGGYMDTMNEPATGIWQIYKNAWQQLPNVPIYANNNPLYPSASGGQYHSIHDDNPIAATNAASVGSNKYINRQFNGQASLEYEIPGIEGLTARGFYSYNYRIKDQTYYQKAYNMYTYDPNTNQYTATQTRNASTGGDNSIKRQNDQWYTTLMQLSLHYKHTFGKVHNVEGLFLFEDQYDNRDNYFAYRNLSLNSQYLFAGDAAGQLGSMNQPDLWDRTGQGFVGKFNYDYMGKYIAEFSFRYDGSSKFMKGARWGFFPSASVGYRISEESFFKESPLSFIDNLKIRASYGKTGDDSDAGNYPPDIVGYNIKGNDLGWIFGSSLTPGILAMAMPNPDLSWYTATMFDIGVDFDLWNGLLGGSFDYFNRNRDGLLTTSTISVPGTTGVQMPQVNLDSDRTFGFEFTLSHHNKIGEFEYNVSANMYATQNMWRTHTQGPAGNQFDNWKNNQNNRYKSLWWGKDYAGQYQNYQQIYDQVIAPKDGREGSSVPGDYYYKDWNGDGVVDDSDNHPIATYGLPLFNYGISLWASYKGFDLSANFQGAARIWYKYTETVAEPLSFGDSGTMTKFWDRWHPVDPNADMFNPSTQWVSGYYPTTGSPLADGTRSVENASYLRLKTLEVGYTLPRMWLSSIGVKSLRVYFSAYNLLTFTGLKSMDPEHPGGDGGAINAVDPNQHNSVDVYKYPINRTFNIGATIKF